MALHRAVRKGLLQQEFSLFPLVSSSAVESLGLGSASAASHTQSRFHGGGVPEFWGRDSPYHPGTDFLGTPKNHLDLVKKRPLSPHVFEVGEYKPHYKMPIAAISSVTNRATGVMLSVGAGAAGWTALTAGDLGVAIESFKQAYPLLVFPAKFAVAFPLVYHYLGGLRHLYWDHYTYGNQSERNSPLEFYAAERSSKMLLGGGVAGAALLALISI